MILLGHVPKDILDKIWKKIALASYEQEKEKRREFLWLNGKKITKPKEDGGQGLNNIHMFEHTLNYKILLKLMKSEGFGEEIMCLVCISHKLWRNIS